jgi:hypothetical protein
MMWNKLSIPWQAAFTEGWESYCNGSIPIGAVLIDSLGNVVSQYEGNCRLIIRIEPRSNFSCRGAGR